MLQSAAAISSAFAMNLIQAYADLWTTRYAFIQFIYSYSLLPVALTSLSLMPFLLPDIFLNLYLLVRANTNINVAPP